MRLIAVLLTLAGCSGSPATPDAVAGDLAAPDLPRDAAVEVLLDLPAPDLIQDSDIDAATADLHTVPDAKISPPPPASYDCTSVAAGPPARTTSVPLSCIIDPSCTTPLVTAHRGAGVDSQEIVGGIYLPIGKFAPENTLLAIRWAIVIGADAVELDVRLAKDGTLVLMHDDTVQRTTLGQGNVADMTLAQLQALQIKTGQFNGDFSCAVVPTFDQALALAKGRINIVADLKTSAGDKVALAAQQAGMVDQVLLSSKSTSTLTLARTAVPQARLQARTGDAQEIPTLLAAFTPPVTNLEIEEPLLTAANLSAIHAVQAKAFVDGFVYDVQGYLAGDPNAYKPLVAKNPDVIQVDRSDLVLQLLGR